MVMATVVMSRAPDMGVSRSGQEHRTGVGGWASDSDGQVVVEFELRQGFGRCRSRISHRGGGWKIRFRALGYGFGFGVVSGVSDTT